MKDKVLSVVPPARFRVTPAEGGRLTIKGASTVRGSCDLGGVLVDGTIEIPEGKRLIIEDDLPERGAS